MTEIKIKRIWEIISPMNALRAAYVGYIDNNEIGILYYDPILEELFPESIKYLNDLGYSDFHITEFINEE